MKTTTIAQWNQKTNCQTMSNMSRMILSTVAVLSICCSGCVTRFTTSSYDVRTKSKEELQRTNFKVEAVSFSGSANEEKLKAFLQHHEKQQNESLTPLQYNVKINHSSSRFESGSVNKFLHVCSLFVWPGWTGSREIYDIQTEIMINHDRQSTQGTETYTTVFGWLLLPTGLFSSFLWNGDALDFRSGSLEERLAEAAFSSLTESRYKIGVAAMRGEAERRLERGEALSDSDERLLHDGVTSQRLLVSRAKHPDNISKSREALSRIRDVDDLVEISLRASILEIREESAERISGLPEDRFASLVRKTKDSSVGQIFLKKVLNDDLLYGIVEDMSVQTTVRTSALEKIQNESVLANIAKSFVHPSSLPQSAVKRIQTESILADVAKNAVLSEVRSIAIGKIENEKILQTSVLNDPSAENRLAALAKIKDPSILGIIVRKSTDIQIRLKTAGRIKSRSILNDMAEKDENETVRLTVLPRVKDPKLLERIAEYDPSVQVRAAAIKRVKNPEVLNRISRNDSSSEMRLLALSRVKDSAIIQDIVENDPDEQVRCAALEMISDSESLGRVARNNSAENIRLSALARVDDRDIIRIVAQEDNSPRIRVAAIQKLEEDETLHRIVLDDPHAEVRHEAIARISNGDVLSTVVLNDDESENRHAALLKVVNPQDLARIVKESVDSQIRLEAVRRISDQDVLSVVARNDSDPDIRVAALDQIRNQAVVRSLAESDPSERVRVAAVEKLDDDGFLETVYKTDTSAIVRKAALSKLSPVAKRRLSAIIKKKSRQHDGIVLAGFHLGMDGEEARILFEATFPNTSFSSSVELSSDRVSRIRMTPAMIQSLSGEVLGIDDIPQATLRFLNVDQLRSEYYDCEVDSECVAREKRYVCDSISGEHLVVHMGGEKDGDWYIKSLEREWTRMDEAFKQDMWNIRAEGYEETPDNKLSWEGRKNKQEFMEKKGKWREAISRRDSFLAGLPPVGTVELTR